MDQSERRRGHAEGDGVTEGAEGAEGAEGDAEGDGVRSCIPTFAFS